MILSFLIILALFLIYVHTRPATFNYERSGLVHSDPEKIFPYISQFKLGTLWNPYDQKDPNSKRVFRGTEGTVGSIMEFEGNKEAGAGHLEILKIQNNESVEIRLIMSRPMSISHIIVYTLTLESNGTRFSWRMYGDCGFLIKLFGVIVNVDKLMGKEFTLGIDNLKKIIEKK